MGSYAGKLSAILGRYGFQFRGNNVPMKCPFCGNDRFFLDDRKGIFTCNHNGCLKSGGTLDFAMAFYSEVLGKNPQNKKEAIAMLEEDLGIETIRKIEVEKKSAVAAAPVRIPVSERNKVYRCMIKHLSLKPFDLESLEKRGYTKEQVLKYGYRSLPIKLEDRKRIARIIQTEGYSLKNMPGFELDKNGDYVLSDFGFYHRKKVFQLQGISDNEIYIVLIPSYDLYGNVQFFQIGWDKRMVGVVETKKYAKYTVLSTPTRNNGGRVNSVCGYCGPYKKIDNMILPKLDGIKEIPIIEGVLKTALFYELSDRKTPCISQVGVSNYKSVRAILQELKEVSEIDTIIDCYDMDKYTEKNVAKGSEMLFSICNEMGFNYVCKKWNPKYKGIDDLYFAVKSKNIS